MNTENPTLIARQARSHLVCVRGIALQILAKYRWDKNMSKNVAHIEASIAGALRGIDALLQSALPKDQE